jgi:nitric oxide reductase NorQ protein
MMSTSAGKEEDAYMKVHPNFCAIFTSNPEEYAGVNRTQDALRDRMITMDLDHFDFETELQITQAKSELSLEDTAKIIKIVRGLRESGKTEFDPTIRGSIMIAKTLATIKSTPSKENEMFRLICQDILTSETSRIGSKTNQEKVRLIVNALIDDIC